MKTVNERLTDAVLDIADTYDDISTARGIAENVLEELLPEITGVETLLTLPPGSLLLGRSGTGWVRMPSKTSPWLSANNGGFGASDGNLREITQRFVDHEAPFRLVWVP